MPLFTPDLKTHQIAGTKYGFSAIRPTEVGASEQTLVVICADSSGSVGRFASDIERCMGEVVRCCASHPRSDNLLLRTVTFEDTLHEVHGFKPLAGCKPTDYQGSIVAGGCTALFDASLNAVESVARYGQELDDHDFEVNGIAFVITDGMDNASSARPEAIAEALARAKQAGALTSMLTVLVGVGVDDAGLSTALRRFETEAGFAAYVELPRADATTLAGLARLVSRSIAAQSVALQGGTLPRLGF